jgi:hypothetical protein
MDFPEIIKDFGVRHRLPQLELDEHGRCSIGDGGLVFSLAHDAATRHLQLEALVGFLPFAEEENGRAKQKLLEMSLLGEGTAGGAAAIDDSGEGVLLVHQVSTVGWGVEDLERLLAALVDAALRLREEANLELAG